ncbi:hypothetical protein ACA910_013011 [Epithemia clementina (nom. ined.)]
MTGAAINWKFIAVSVILVVWQHLEQSEGLAPSAPYGRSPRPFDEYQHGNNNKNNNGKQQRHRRPNRRTRPVVAVSRLEEDTRTDAADSLVPSSIGTDHPTKDVGSRSPAQIEREIVVLGRKGRIDQALEVFNSLKRPSVRQMNAIIDACSRSRPVRLDLAFDILRTTGAVVPPNVYTFGSLMSVCARAGSVQHAIRLLKTMEREYGVTPNAVVYNSAISACGRANPPQFDVALKLLQESRDRGLRMSVVGYNAAISAAARAGDWQGALDLLRQMEQSRPQPSTILDSDSGDDVATRIIPRPDAVSYGTVLSAFERGGKWERILEFADYMQSKGQPLDGLAITSVLHACQSLGLADEAIRYLNLMKDSNSLNQQRRRTFGLEFPGGRTPLDGPDAVAYLLAISACARGGDWINGVELLNEYCRNTTIIRRTDPTVDVNLYTAAITGCEYAGQWEEAFLLLERMRKANVEPNDVALAAVIGACATACAKLQAAETGTNSKDGKATNELEPMKKALRLLAVMNRDESVVSPTPLVYNAVIRTCAEAHDLKRAFKVFEAMESENNLQPNIVTFGSLMTACERVGSSEGMDTVFNLLKKAGLKPNDVIYGAAISCCRKAGGEAQRAYMLFQKMVSDGLQPNVATVNTVLMAQAEARNTDNVARVYKLLCSTVAGAASKSGLSVKPNRQTFNIIIRAFADKKQAKEAEAVLHDMRESGFPPDVDLYTLVVSAYERTGQPLQALRLMESMNTQGYAFYEDKVLNAAFKRLLKMANMVGQSLASTKEQKQPPKSIFVLNESDDDAFKSYRPS